MMHLIGPASWTVTSIARWVATSLAVAFIGTIIEENIRHLAEERHWNEFLTSAINAMPDVSFLTESYWFWF
jgi:hypothetical protein